MARKKLPAFVYWFEVMVRQPGGAVLPMFMKQRGEDAEDAEKKARSKCAKYREAEFVRRISAKGGE